MIDELEVRSDFAFVRELRVQLLSLCSRWFKLRKMILRPRLWIAFRRRIVLADTQVPPPPVGGHSETLCEAIDSSRLAPHVLAELNACKAIEAYLLAQGKRELLLETRDRIEIACHHAQWRVATPILAARFPERFGVMRSRFKLLCLIAAASLRRLARQLRTFP